jgi:thiol-disulfide isomerase/thioredoxin
VTDHPVGTRVNLFEFGYLRLTPHQYRWGRTVAKGNAHVINPGPPEKATWAHAGAEEFGGETCDVVASADRAERLWVGRVSGRVRGVMSYRGGEKVTPNELIRFDDYREVAPGVWLPFRETRGFVHSSETVPGKSLLRRSELVVEEARTDADLTEDSARLLPKEGDRVQDQRFATPVDYKYGDRRTDDAIRAKADEQYRKQLQSQEEIVRALKPIAAMVGKPAPELPAGGWVGGRRPDLAGKPYLVHFWATTCGPCKGDNPRLKKLSEQGLTVVGLHPPGVPADELERVIRDQSMPYPTLVGDGKDGGYPFAVFPYCVLVDARGRVATHGFLSELTPAVESALLIQEFARKAAPQLAASRWLNAPDELALAKLKGKVVLLDFWGQWCGPCVESLPDVERLHAEFKDRGLVVIGVHSAKESGRLDEFLKAKRVTFPVMIDHGETAERYRIDSWPRYVLISKSGAVVWGFTHEPPTPARVADLLGE